MGADALHGEGAGGVVGGALPQRRRGRNRCRGTRTCAMLLISNFAASAGALCPGACLTEKEATMGQRVIDPNDLPYADGDFFAFEQLLSGKEQDRLARSPRLRWPAKSGRSPSTAGTAASSRWNSSRSWRISTWSAPSGGRATRTSSPACMHAEATRADTSIATFMGVHDGLFTGSIEALASQEQQDAWLPDIYSLKKIGAFGLTEPLGGSDVAGGTRTTARRDGDNWILNGAKRWIGNATFSDWVVIYARDVADNQVKGFLVDTMHRPDTAPRKSRTRSRCGRCRTRTSPWRTWWCRTSSSSPTPTASATPTRSSRSPGSAVAWQAVGQQLAAFDVARRYAVERHQFGTPLASFQLVQHQLVQILGNAVSFDGHDGPAVAAGGRRPGQGRAVRAGQGVHHGPDARKRGPGPRHPGRQRDRDRLRDGQDLLPTPKPSTPTRAPTRSTPWSPAGLSRASPRSSDGPSRGGPNRAIASRPTRPVRRSRTEAAGP